MRYSFSSLLFSQRLVLLLQILSAYFPWHRFLWDDGNFGFACFRTIRSPSLISIMLCKDVVFTPQTPVLHARAWQTMLLRNRADALPVLIFKNALHPEFLCVVVVFPSHILLLPLPSSGAEEQVVLPKWGADHKQSISLIAICIFHDHPDHSGLLNPSILCQLKRLQI